MPLMNVAFRYRALVSPTFSKARMASS